MSEIKKGKMIIIKFTEEQHAILQEFLSRVQLIGKEVPTYVEILNIVNRGAEQNGE